MVIDRKTAAGQLCRRVYSKTNARQARLGRTPLQEFMPPAGKMPLALSVDGPPEAAAFEMLADLARRGEKTRSGSFQGWACVRREVAGQSSRQVVAEPLDENPYHEEIHMPSELFGNREAQKAHAAELADNAHWCEGGQPQAPRQTDAIPRT